jgi:hypothetical protein
MLQKHSPLVADGESLDAKETPTIPTLIDDFQVHRLAAQRRDVPPDLKRHVIVTGCHLPPAVSAVLQYDVGRPRVGPAV